MKADKDKDNQVKKEEKYFATPSTSLDEQMQINNFNDFNISNEAYKILTTRLIIKKYAIR